MTDNRRLGSPSSFKLRFLAYRHKSESHISLPPSPPSWRVRGHFLPHHHPSLTIARWVDKYSPLITIRSRFENIVIIGRYKAAVDITENQGKFTADQMFNGAISIAFVPFGDRFRRMRRTLHSHLQPKANTILGILDDPCNYHNHVTICAATTIMKTAYGKSTPTSATDPEVVEIKQRIKMSRIIMRPGTYLEFENTKKLNAGQLNRVKEQMSIVQQSDKDIGPSFAKYMLENIHLHSLTDIEMAFLGGSLFLAGSSTRKTSAAISTVFMAATCFPEEQAQAQAQAELDAVIGRHRVPTFADQDSLPRLQAFISEALRWRPPLPTGGRYRCDLGKTTLFGNHWSISRDPDVYPEPDAFKPQRWIDVPISVFINSLLTMWAFQLTLDPTKPLDDMEFMNGVMTDVPPCAIKFETRIPELELRRMMQHYPQDA
ncbi:cytochrome P450 [Suillus subaureus]|uniref:Cytochrome P450 n=1 Tax=Suillus subaureus TaxID=48587 RepID=A0A9P7J6P6_9AGAM|nr:cytochrome P450 [Suillus subaureus]KAG1805310.1 cytochrome P450 [Suillus subaureus]